MGVAVADFDEDGYVDILKTNFTDDVPNFYHNNRDGSFTDDVFQSGLGVHTQYIGWGILALDVDHDGRKDALMINGHVYPEVDQAKLAAKYAVKEVGPVLYEVAADTSRSVDLRVEAFKTLLALRDSKVKDATVVDGEALVMAPSRGG